MANFVGVDGCRSGWFSVKIAESGAASMAVDTTFAALYDRYDSAESMLVDIPIGLPTDSTRRECDVQVRRLLGPRRSSVFSAPARQSITGGTHAEASRLNRATTGRGLSIQAYALIPKIRQVDDLLRGGSTRRGQIREVHPELLFYHFNRRIPARASKRTAVGVLERIDLVSRHYPAAREVFFAAESMFLRRDVARDDILDALAAAVTAWLGRGSYHTVPDSPPTDSAGLPMEMVWLPLR